MQIRVPPSNASIATPNENGKLFAPSAARNSKDLCDLLASNVPSTGQALELASGTGQHIVALAAATPAIRWQPSEVDPVRLRSIEAYIDESELSNISNPITLDATQSGWGKSIEPKTLILVTNLFHLVSADEVATLLEEVSHALTESGLLFLYGPFRRDGKLTSEGDAKFDADLRASDPEIGYKDDRWVQSVSEQLGLSLVGTHKMPANNLVLIFQKSLLLKQRNS